MLYDAGGDINNRNRYGAYDPSDWIIEVEKATISLECFLTRGGKPHEPYVINSREEFLPLRNLSNRRMKRGSLRPCRVAICVALIKGSCRKCKKAKYCSPPLWGCQKWDWHDAQERLYGIPRGMHLPLWLFSYLFFPPAARSQFREICRLAVD